MRRVAALGHPRRCHGGVGGRFGLDPGQAGEAGSKIKVLSLTPPPERKAGQMVAGETPQEKGAGLVKLLREEAKII